MFIIPIVVPKPCLKSLFFSKTNEEENFFREYIEILLFVSIFFYNLMSFHFGNPDNIRQKKNDGSNM